MSEEQHKRIHTMLERHKVKFSGCQIFQISNSLQNIRQMYGDVKVCLVRLPSTTLLFDQVYRDYCSIILYLYYTQNPYFFQSPLLRIYFIDGLQEDWEAEVAKFIQSDEKESLVVLENVWGADALKIHYDRIEAILEKLNPTSSKDGVKDIDEKNK
jgi:hypothetical protein